MAMPQSKTRATTKPSKRESAIGVDGMRVGQFLVDLPMQETRVLARELLRDHGKKPAVELEVLSASELKQCGVSAAAKRAKRKGPVVVTNHEKPEVVIMSMEMFSVLVSEAKKGMSAKADALDSLRKDFDMRLALLKKPGASEKLRKIATTPVKLGGKVKAGESY